MLLNKNHKRLFSFLSKYKIHETKYDLKKEMSFYVKYIRPLIRNHELPLRTQMKRIRCWSLPNFSIWSIIAEKIANCERLLYN